MCHKRKSVSEAHVQETTLTSLSNSNNDQKSHRDEDQAHNAAQTRRKHATRRSQHLKSIGQNHSNSAEASSIPTQLEDLPSAYSWPAEHTVPKESSMRLDLLGLSNYDINLAADTPRSALDFHERCKELSANAGEKVQNNVESKTSCFWGDSQWGQYNTTDVSFLTFAEDCDGILTGSVTSKAVTTWAEDEDARGKERT